MQLSWDLHVHPGPSSVPRWGIGAEIQATAARAGVAGFVWKSHDGHTIRQCLDLPHPTPVAIGSASTNEWATAASIEQAITDGARWIWGTTHSAGRVGWDLPLHRDWSTIAGIVRACQTPLVLATGHLSSKDRLVLAELAAGSDKLRCSITHSLYLGAPEAATLRELGCLFEVDLFTATRAVHGRPPVNLARGIRQLSELGADVYLTTDCGQVEVGDPYLFSARILTELESELGTDTLEQIARRKPAALAAHALKET